MSLDFKNLISKGLLTLSDIYGLLTKGILKGQLALPHLPPKKTSGAKAKRLKKPVVLVSRQNKFNLRGIKRFKAGFSAQIIGLKRFTSQIRLSLTGVVRSTGAFLGQIKGILLVPASFKKVIYGAKTIQRAVSHILSGVTKHKGPGSSAVLVGVRLTRGKYRAGSYGRKLTRAHKKLGISAVKLTRNKAASKLSGVVKSKSKSALPVRGRRDITAILAALGILEADDED